MAIARQRFYGPNNLDFARGDIFEDIPFPRFTEVDIDNQASVDPWRIGTDEARGITAINAAAGEIGKMEGDDYGTAKFEIVRTPVLAMCVTPTCDINSCEFLSFIPLEPLNDVPEDEISRSVLFSQTSGYDDLFGVYDPTDGLVGDCLAQFSLIFPVPRSALANLEKLKIKSLSVETQDFLSEKLARYHGKAWGYSPTEPVELPGWYGCIHCRTFHGLPLNEIQLTAGDFPPKCDTCERHRRKPSWRLLRTPKRLPMV
ncbi:MAG: hypothetical protein HIU91_07555 [Acidobacteria bacterium]|nr:hypothetical protein [Acidobacteriota bacterium]